MDEAILAAKLAELADRVARLGEVTPPEVEDFVADRTARELAAFNLVLAIQVVVDLATMLLADRGWGVPESVSASFRALAERGVLEGGLAGRLSEAARMRNLLVHRYGVVDEALVHGAIVEHLGDLTDGAHAIAKELRADA